MKNKELFPDEKTRISLQVSKLAWVSFQNACELNETNPSVEIRRFMRNYTNEAQRKIKQQ